MAGFEEYLDQLHPAVRGVALQFLQEAAAAGLDPRVQEAFRSPERQNELYAQGRTAPGAVVTKAKGGQSNHNYGVAFDVVPGALLGQPNWAPESPLWTQLGEIGQKTGLEWGGNWKFVDKPHFQMKGANWREMQNNPEFAHFHGDGHKHGVSGPPQAPGTPAPAMGPPQEIRDRPIAAAPPPAPSQPGPIPAAAAPGGDAPSGFGAVMSSIAPMMASMQMPDQQQAPSLMGDGGAGAQQGAMNAAMGAEQAAALPRQFMPDIDALMGLAKRPKGPMVVG